MCGDDENYESDIFSDDDDRESSGGVGAAACPGELLLMTLRREWRHLVSETGCCEVYVGRGGGGRWGNRVTRPAIKTRLHHEEAVVGYGRWLLTQPARMATVRACLGGRLLGCHCRPGRDLPCHAEVLSAVANCSHGEYRVLIGGGTYCGGSSEGWLTPVGDA